MAFRWLYGLWGLNGRFYLHNDLEAYCNLLSIKSLRTDGGKVIMRR